jgi:hypothetical protein
VFDEDPSIVRRVAKLAVGFRIHELRIDDSILPHSPLKKLEIFVILAVTIEVEHIFLDLLTGDVAVIEFVHSVLSRWLLARVHAMPVLTLEGR